MRIYLALVLLLSFNILIAQSLKQIYKKSIEAYDDNNFTEFRDFNLKALELHPSQPTFLYNLASSYSLTNDLLKSKTTLELLLSWDSSLSYLNDKDFENLLAHKKYNDVLNHKKQEYGLCKLLSSDFFEISKKSHVEDIIIKDDFVFTTDLHRGILTKFNYPLNYIEESLYFDSAPLAITKSENEEFIYVSTSVIKNYKSYDANRLHESKLYKIRIVDMTIIDVIELNSKAVIGSMSVLNGQIYATNSLNPEIIIVNENTFTIKETVKVKEAFNLQGITVNEASNKIYVADYIKGVITLNLDNIHEQELLKLSKDLIYLLKGIDGIAYSKFDNALYAIQNNSKPHRLIRLMLSNETENTIKDIEIIDNLVNCKGEPTNLKIDAGKLYYLSNSQWPYYNNHGQPNYAKWMPQQIRKMIIITK